MTLQKFYLFENEVSLLSGLRQLVEQGRWLLVLIIGGFSLLLPLLKLLLLWRLLQSWTLAPAWQRWLHWVHHYGKWSMLDVFVVAILVMSVKLGPLATTELHYGLYLFSTSVVMMMIASNIVYRKVRRVQT
jgi:paraquat-inducible protein A